MENSATVQQRIINLSVEFVVDKTDITIFLYEYNCQLVKNYSTLSPDEYSITALSPDGTKLNLAGTMFCESDRVVIDEAYNNRILDMLKMEGMLSFYLVKRDTRITTYSFSVETSDFNALYTSTFS